VIDDDEDFEDDEDTGPIRLWPALVAVAIMAVLAVGVAFVAVRSNEEDTPEAGPERTMRLVLAAPGDAGAVRLVTVARGCLQPVRATADLRADAVAFTVYGQESREDCAAGDELRCNEVVLPQAVGPRRVVPEPVAEYRDQAAALVASGPCPPLSVEA
jgi:hypothetical protein